MKKLVLVLLLMASVFAISVNVTSSYEGYFSPGQEKYITFNFKNTGSETSDYLVDIYSDNPKWTVNRSSFNNYELNDIGSGETANIEVWINSSYDITEDEDYQIVVEVDSQGDNDIFYFDFYASKIDSIEIDYYYDYEVDDCTGLDDHNCFNELVFDVDAFNPDRTKIRWLRVNYDISNSSGLCYRGTFLYGEEFSKESEKWLKNSTIPNELRYDVDPVKIYFGDCIGFYDLDMTIFAGSDYDRYSVSNLLFARRLQMNITEKPNKIITGEEARIKGTAFYDGVIPIDFPITVRFQNASEEGNYTDYIKEVNSEGYWNIYFNEFPFDEEIFNLIIFGRGENNFYGKDIGKISVNNSVELEKYDMSRPFEKVNINSVGSVFTVHPSSLVNGSIPMVVSNTNPVFVGATFSISGRNDLFSFKFPDSTVLQTGSNTILINTTLRDHLPPGTYPFTISMKTTYGSKDINFSFVVPDSFDPGSVSAKKYFDYESNSVILRAKNTMSLPVNLTLTETIPKAFAESVDDVSFSVEPTRIVDDDPVVEWFFEEVAPGEIKEINYSINSELAPDLFSEPSIVFTEIAPPVIVQDPVVNQTEENDSEPPVVTKNSSVSVNATQEPAPVQLTLEPMDILVPAVFIFIILASISFGFYQMQKEFGEKHSENFEKVKEKLEKVKKDL